MKTGRNKKLVIGGGALIAVLLILSLSMGRQKIPVTTAPVTMTAIQAYVEEQARTSLPHTYRITMPLDGTIMPLMVKEGEVVKVGQTVANIDDIDWQDRKKEAKDIVRAVDGWMISLNAQVKASELKRDNVLKDYQRNEKLSKTSSISKKAFQDSQYHYLNALVKLQESHAMLSMSKAVQAITELLPHYVKRNLVKTIIKSPVNGTVLKRHVWNQKVMNAGAPLLDIGDMNTLEVTADVLTEQAVLIQKGNRVEIYSGAVGPKTVLGTVKQVEPLAFTKVSSLGVDEQRVPVKITFNQGVIDDLNQRGRQLGLKYRVRVKVITQEKKNTLVIPRTALFQGMNNEWQVYQVQEGQAVLKTVKVGLMNDYQAEITQGLKEKDSVIVAPESSITNGVKVTTE